MLSDACQVCRILGPLSRGEESINGMDMPMGGLVVSIM